MDLLRGVIGVALRRARTERGLTLRDVADAANVSVQYLSEVERGLKEASSEVLGAICAALGWTILDLLDAARAELVAVTHVQITGFALPEPAGQGREVVPQAATVVQLAA
jgi:transcriptional regulator with XRE-family HTH domain